MSPLVNYWWCLVVVMYLVMRSALVCWRMLTYAHVCSRMQSSSNASSNAHCSLLYIHVNAHISQPQFPYSRWERGRDREREKDWEWEREEKDRDTDRDRDGERQTETERQRQRQRQTERQRQREKELLGNQRPSHTEYWICRIWTCAHAKYIHYSYFYIRLLQVAARYFCFLLLGSAMPTAVLEDMARPLENPTWTSILAVFSFRSLAAASIVSSIL